MARARIEGKHVGRPRLDDRTRRQVRELRQQKPDLSIRAIARETEVPYATTRRLLLEREKPRINVHRVLFPLTVPSLGVSRLDGKQDDIRRFLELGVSKTAISKITGVSRTALYSFMSTRGLRPSPSRVFQHESG